MPGPRSFPFQQVDVFTKVPFKGNPLAVVFEGDALATEEMQAIANWTNLSETVFICRPTHAAADYRLRLFTPRTELPFAGHPTIGSAFAVRSRGLTGKTPGHFVQECAKGLVTVRVDDDRLYLQLPSPAFRQAGADELGAAAKALGVRAGDIRHNAIVDVGPIWFTLQLRDADQVVSLKPDMGRLATLQQIGVIGVTVFGLHANGGSSTVEVRSFSPSEGIPEDPVCGSGNGCVAAVVQRHAILSDSGYIAGQGRCLGRDGRVHVRFDDDGSIWVGGNVVTCIEGTLTV